MVQKSFSKLSSDTISALRFPLMVGIVLLHANILHLIPDFTYIPTWLSVVFSISYNEIPKICVPLYFLISGVLFFRTELTFESYKSKIRRRIHSLVVPYMVWNILALLYSLAKSLPAFKPICPNMPAPQWGFINVIATFWNRFAGVFPAYGVENHSLPQDGVLWFVRELMTVAIMSPCLFYLIKRLKIYFVMSLVILWYVFVPCPTQTYFTQLLTAIAFFSVGAYFPIVGKDFIETSRRFKYTPLIYFFLLATCLITQDTSYYKYIQNLAIAVGIVATVCLASKGLRMGNTNKRKFLTDSTFFIYACHWIFLSDLAKIMVKLFSTINTRIVILLAFLVPTVTILICLALYWLLRKFIPRLCTLLTGGR